MTHLFINGLAASAGGGLTYLRNVVPALAARDDAHATVLLSASLRSEFGDHAKVDILEVDAPAGAFPRFWWEQACLPSLIRQSGADVLVSAGNFAVRRSPIPQILLSRNSLYTSRDFALDLCHRRKFTLWLDTRAKAWLAKRSINWADVTVAPSEAFARELEVWSGERVTTIHHGFDGKSFTTDRAPLPPQVKRQLDGTRDCLRLLFVSHYNYYRNFETLLRALPRIRAASPRPVRLLLTCHLRPKANPGSYDPRKVACLVRHLGLSDEVVELGTVSYNSLHHIYRACDIYVSPAYTESFAHPLVEAMAQGLPLAVSGLEVHREICGEAALYFDPFSPERLAQTVLQIAGSQELASKLGVRGLERSRLFSWERHVDELIGLAAHLAGKTLEQRQFQLA